MKVGPMKRLRAPHIPYASDIAALVLRLAVGTVLLGHGLPKLQRGAPSLGAFLDTLGVPAPRLSAYAVIVIEVGGGLLLLVGFLTRLWGALVAGQMVLITFVVKRDVGLIAPQGQGTGFELDLLMLAGALALVAIGPGLASIDRAAGIDGGTERPVPGP